MKKLFLVMLIMMLAVPAFAQHNTAGVKLDMPQIVKISDDVLIGIQVGKDIWSEIGYPDVFDYVEGDKGFFGFLKVTCKWTLFDFGKK